MGDAICPSRSRDGSDTELKAAQTAARSGARCSQHPSSRPALASCHVPCVPRVSPCGAGTSSGCCRIWASPSYPHAVALEDVVAVERWGVQGGGRRLVLDGAGEGGRAGTQTLGDLRGGSGAARAQNKATGVSADRQTNRADNAGNSGFCARSLWSHLCSRFGTFLLRSSSSL